MQPFDKDGEPLGDPTQFDMEEMKKLLAQPKVDHVKVFRLQLGDELKIKNKVYVVTKLMSGGRAMIKRRG